MAKSSLSSADGEDTVGLEMESLSDSATCGSGSVTQAAAGEGGEGEEIG